MLSRASHALLFLSALTVWAGSASAQPWTGERWVRGRPHRIAGEASFFTRPPRYAFAPGISARFRLVDESPWNRDAFIVDLDAAWRAVGVAGPEDSFRAGNPYVGLRLGWREPTWRFRAGAGTTLPLTNAFSDGPDDYAAYYYGQALHGGYDGWLLEPEIQPLVVKVDFELHGEYFQFGVDAALGVLFPIRNGGGGRTEVAFQSGIFGAVVPVEELALGARFQFWFASNHRAGFGGVDEAQLALIPLFVRLQLEPFFLEARLLMNLDEPYGWAFDPPGVWAVSLIAGGRF